MKAVLLAFCSLALLVIAFVVLRGVVEGARYALVAGASEAKMGRLSLGGAGPQASGPYTVQGTAIMDTSQGIPAVPYIQYLDQRHATSTKQLVYMDARACAPGASDIPCVPPYSASDGYPQLTTGERITVTGYIYEDRFLVTALSIQE